MLHRILLSVIKSRRMGWADSVRCMGDMRNVYKIVLRKLEGKRSLRRSRGRFKDNIRMAL
jgi:hypothetical protein